MHVWCVSVVFVVCDDHEDEPMASHVACGRSRQAKQSMTAGLTTPSARGFPQSSLESAFGGV